MRRDPKSPVAAVSYAGWRNLKNNHDTMVCVRKIKKESDERQKSRRSKRRRLFNRHRKPNS